ncbi:MAG: UDP-N-acetylmuramate--L-alanine ligase [Thermoleophilaceae bacterium]|nr:UDP-N-acetylmuramate--L-alanine ligase [Thermoleophilaceae bacterium]
MFGRVSFGGRRLHFVGIGGAGMSGLALVARGLGGQVSGSDRAESVYTERLRGAGIEPRIGHAAENVPEGAELVVSTAIPADNPEVAGRETIHRGDLLGEITRMKRCIAVAGAHGKTTVTSMIAHVLAPKGAAYLIGGELRSSGTNAAWGEGEWIVVEADESDRSFLKLAPEVAVVTNLELDHHTAYASFAELVETFEAWVAPVGRRIQWEAVELPGPDVTYGLAGADLTPAVVPLELAVPGEHNVLNALAAVAACREAGVPVEESARALASFTGAGRRFEPRGRSAGGAEVYDDYAHHPTEVRATLEAARTLEPGRVVACFQPHLFSRTQKLAREFGRALALADVVYVVDVYPAREAAEDFPGVDGYLVAKAAAHAARGRPVHWVPGLDEATSALAGELREGDLLLTLGAGDVERVAAGLTAT